MERWIYAQPQKKLPLTSDEQARLVEYFNGELFASAANSDTTLIRYGLIEPERECDDEGHWYNSGAYEITALGRAYIGIVTPPNDDVKAYFKLTDWQRKVMDGMLDVYNNQRDFRPDLRGWGDAPYDEGRVLDMSALLTDRLIEQQINPYGRILMRLTDTGVKMTQVAHEWQRQYASNVPRTVDEVVIQMNDHAHAFDTGKTIAEDRNDDIWRVNHRMKRAVEELCDRIENIHEGIDTVEQMRGALKLLAAETRAVLKDEK